MAIDYREKEREFLDGLKECTGRDLAEWMDVISAQDLPHRNDIIDWLRHQGFMFSHASWLERIHHNGGRPIYGDGATASLMASRLPRERSAPKPEAEQQEPQLPANDDQPPEPMARAPVSPVSTPSAPAPAGDDDLTALLAKAKAYRPLAQHLIAQIKTVRPNAHFLARSSAVAMADPEEFAALAITGKELRLHLALDDDDDGELFKKAAPPPGLGSALGKQVKFTHMLVLTDARQIDRRLLDFVARAAAKVNAG